MPFFSLPKPAMRTALGKSIPFEVPGETVAVKLDSEEEMLTWPHVADVMKTFEVAETLSISRKPSRKILPR